MTHSAQVLALAQELAKRGRGKVADQRILEAIIDGKLSSAIFPGMAISLYAFTRRLYEELSRSGVRNVFFFSREGKLLQEMFDFYQRSQPQGASFIVSHYLEVSRRSTFLISLGPIENERFDTLFRQYRSISISEFLKSLGLDEYLRVFANGLSVPGEDFERRCADLPTNPLFRRLIESCEFCAIYEQERLLRSKAFHDYLKTFTRGEVPETFHVVDVGWKGTIQDNLSGWLNRNISQDTCIQGYYVGLIASGSLNVKNKKKALLFSLLGEKTAGARIFSENRSLFEVLLAADHGSPKKYIYDECGLPIVVREPFVEKEVIETRIQPVIAGMMNGFRNMVEAAGIVALSMDDAMALALRCHAKMVYRPTKIEIEWFMSISHVENFGVFETSNFDGTKKQIPFYKRLRFTLRLLKGRKGLDLGFWPWLMIDRHALAGTSAAYAMRQTYRR